MHTYIIQTANHTHEVHLEGHWKCSHAHANTHRRGQPTRSLQRSHTWEHNDGAFRGCCLMHTHTQTPGMFWPPYMNLPDIFRWFKTTSSMNKQRAEKTKKKQWLSFMQNSPVCSRFPWAIIAELHALFHCCVIGTLIFYEYQACPLVSVG